MKSVLSFQMWLKLYSCVGLGLSENCFRYCHGHGLILPASYLTCLIWSICIIHYTEQPELLLL